MNGCPERDQIRLFLGGSCGDEWAEAIANHLAECVVCSVAAKDIARQSDTIARLVELADRRLELEPACQEARRRLLGSSPPVMMPSLPLTLGQYELVEPIGRGGMGRVFKAHHRHLKRTIAIKLLSPERAHDAEAVAAFLREMEAIGRLDSPYIVRATDASCVDGVYFLVMDYIPGADLARLLDRVPRLDVADACEIIRQAALGLQYAHENGLVHCDIKPSNLMLTDQGLVKILDLGLARFQAGNCATLSATVAGTVDYMAPEQWQPNAELDIRTDIYALGCTLFKLLTGSAPYEKAGTNRCVSHESAPIPNLSERHSGVLVEMSVIATRMLAKKPEGRFGEPRDLALAVAPFCAGSRLPRLAQRVIGPTSDTVRMRDFGETIVHRKSLPRAKAVPGKPWLALALALGLVVVVAICAVFSRRLFDRTREPWTSSSVAGPSIEQAGTTEHIGGQTSTWRPVKFVWPDDASGSFWEFDQDRNELFISCTGMALFSAGNIAAPSYEIRATIEQIHWERVGVFFGFRTPKNGPAGTAQYQLIELMGEHDGKFTFERHLVNLFGGRTHSVDICGISELPAIAGPHVLTIRVQQGSLQSVHWDGKRLNGLVASTMNRRLPSDSSAFGTFNDRSTSQFCNVVSQTRESD
jgi:serine/threonine protein kinase